MKRERIVRGDIFPYRIHRIDDFVEPDFRVIDPFLKRSEYVDYWKGIAQKGIHGVWGEDRDFDTGKGGFRWCPPTLWTQTNLRLMKQKIVGTRRQEKKKPNLRDIDWWNFYGIEEAFGFSGFSNDIYYTCCDLVLLMERGIPLDEDQKIIVNMFEDDLKAPDGTWKKYMNAKEYLYQTFDKPMGRALYQNQAKNDMYVSGRRIGKTEGYVSVSLHKLIFGNAESYDDFINKTTSANIIITSFLDDKTHDVYKKLWDSHDNIRNYGSWTYDIDTKKGPEKKRWNGALWHPFDGGNELNKVRTDRVTVTGGKRKEGRGTQIKRTSTYSGISTAIGGEPDFIHAEEAGAWKSDLQGFHDLADPATTKNDEKFGVIGYSLTGGEMKYAKQAIPLFKNPKKINAVEYYDQYTKSNDPIAKFAPSHYNIQKLRDPQGNIDKKAAFKAYMRKREEQFKLGPQKFINYISQNPATYIDAFMEQTTGSLPVDRASQRNTMIQSSDLRDRWNYKKSAKIQVGQIDIIDKEKRIVKFRKTEDTPITNPDIKKKLHRNDHKGAVVIYEPPAPDEKCQYLTVYDAVEHTFGTSMCCAFVFKFWTNSVDKRLNFAIVAEHIYRNYGHKSKDKNDLQPLKLAMLYNCELGPETNKSRILDYADTMGWYNILADCPIDAKRLIVPGASPKYDKGVYVAPGMIDGLIEEAAEVLMTKVDEEEFIGEDGLPEEDKYGKKIMNDIWMVDTIDSEYFLNDVIFYKKGSNHDYMSAFFVLCLYIRQRLMNGSLDEKGDMEGNDLYSDFMSSVGSSVFEQEISEDFDY